MSDQDIQAQDDRGTFLSLASLKDAHTDLLKRYHSDEISERFFSDASAFIKRGRATGALLDADDDRSIAQSLLDYWVTVLYRAGQEPPEAVLAEFDRNKAPKLADHMCPFMGLDAFQTENHDLFFGRKRLVDNLIKKVKTDRLVAIVGPSGSGKSSLVLAGLRPKLQAGELNSSHTWRYFPPIVPGSNPLESMARLVKNAKMDLPLWQQTTTDEFQDPNHLSKLMMDLGGTPVVLIVDQFEEVFTLCGDDKIRHLFIDNILCLAQLPAAKHIVILTMRSDYEMLLSRFPKLQASFEQAQVRVTPLTPDELRDAIEIPSATVGLRFQNGLVDALIEDLLGEPAGLPLLQFTLLKLWEYRENNWVTWDAYQRLGGGRGALATSADNFYEKLIPENQQTAKRILLRLVQPGEMIEFTKKRIRCEALYQIGEDPSRIKLVLDGLIKARLIRLTKGDTPADDQVEVAHEALVRNWPTLVNWLEEERVSLRRVLRVSRDAEEWTSQDKDPGLLYRGSRLDEAIRDVAHEDLDEIGSNFIKASMKQRDLEKAEKEAQHQRELANLKKLADSERHRRNLLIVGIGCLLSLLAAALFFAYQAFNASKAARIAELNVRSKALAYRAIHQFEKLRRDDRAALLARKAYLYAQDNSLVEVDNALRTILGAPFFRNCLQFEKQAISVAFSPAGNRLAVALDGQCPQLFDLKEPRNPTVRLCTSAEQILVNFSPDGKKLATGAKDGIVRVWDVENDQPQENILPGRHSGQVTSVVFSPDGRRIASSDSDGTIRLWNLQHVDKPGDEIAKRDGSINCLAFSHDGIILASAGVGGAVRFQNLQYPDKPVKSIETNEEYVTSIAFLHDGSTFAAAGYKGIISLWDLKDLESQPKVLDRGHKGPITSIAVSPDGRTLVSVGHDETLCIWNLKNSVSDPTALTGHNNIINSVAISTDGYRVASASSDNTVRIWELKAPPAMPIVCESDIGMAKSVTYAPTGNTIASVHAGGQLLLWRIKDNTCEKIFENNSVATKEVFFTDEYTLASVLNNGTVQLLNMEDFDQPATEAGILEDLVRTSEISSDGMVLVWTGKDGAFRQSDLQNLDEPTIWVKELKGSVNATALSAGGQTLALAISDGIIQVQDLQNLDKHSEEIGEHYGLINDLAFSKKGRFLASAGEDGTVRVWDIKNKTKSPGIIGSHQNRVNSIAFSPDESTLASAGDDGTVKVFNLQDPVAQTAVLKGHDAPVLSVAFSPRDGKRLVSGDDNGNIYVWIVQTEEISDEVCNQVLHDLSKKEWEDFVGRGIPYKPICRDFKN